MSHSVYFGVLHTRRPTEPLGHEIRPSWPQAPKGHQRLPQKVDFSTHAGLKTAASSPAGAHRGADQGYPQIGPGDPHRGCKTSESEPQKPQLRHHCLKMAEHMALGPPCALVPPEPCIIPACTSQPRHHRASALTHLSARSSRLGTTFEDMALPCTACSPTVTVSEERAVTQPMTVQHCNGATRQHKALHSKSTAPGSRAARHRATHQKCSQLPAALHTGSCTQRRCTGSTGLRRSIAHLQNASPCPGFGRVSSLRLDQLLGYELAARGGWGHRWPPAVGMGCSVAHTRPLGQLGCGTRPFEARGSAYSCAHH